MDEFLQVRADKAHKATLDALRKREDDLPSRSEMVRRLIERAGAKLKGGK